MTAPSIGTQITFNDQEQRKQGRIVGHEDAGQRHRMPRGRLFYVQVDGEDGAREIHENAIREQLQ